MKGWRGFDPDEAGPAVRDAGLRRLRVKILAARRAGRSCEVEELERRCQWIVNLGGPGNAS